MKLYTYFRSSAAYRVRIALNLKGLDAEQIPVDLRTGEQQRAPLADVNVQHLVPALVTAQGVLTQSLAIIEYLDEMHPEPPLLPTDPWRRAQARAMAQLIACDIHPLNNLRVLQYLRTQLEQSEDAIQTWYTNWIRAGFIALEQLTPTSGYLASDHPMLADVVLVPQVYNARRYGMDLGEFPRLSAVAERCEGLPAFAAAAPERQAQ